MRRPSRRRAGRVPGYREVVAGAAPPTAIGDRSQGVRQTTAALRVLLRVAAVLVTLAGIQLFVLTTRTDRYFAWTIASPLTAAFLGAGYWASAPLEWLTGRERAWARCRPAVGGVFVFTVLTLAATLLHEDAFHFGPEFAGITRTVTWTWLAVYVVVPVAFVVLLAGQLRRPGGDPPRAWPLPRWMRATVSVQAAVMLVLGTGLFVDIDRVGPWWPWPLTPLTARAVGAWLVALAVIGFQAVRENDFARLGSIMVSNLLLGVLQVVALARYPGAVDWSPEGSVYVGFLLSLILVGAHGTRRVLALGVLASPEPGPRG